VTERRVPISAVVMTFNEEVNLVPCLESLFTWVDEIFVVDSFSTDQTESIARRYSKHFIQHRYESHPAQWIWALENLPFRNEWIFAIDADFRVSEELKQKIGKQLEGVGSDVAGIYVRHRQNFQGRFIRFGSIYPRYWLRLFRKKAVFVDSSDLVDLHFYVRGKTMKFESDLIEDNVKERDLSFWLEKQIRFAQRAAVEEMRRREALDLAPIQPRLFGSPDQRTLWLKSKWYFFPLFWRSALYFIYRYFLRLGFLDGKEGFLYHFTQAFVYRVCVDANIDALIRQGKVSGASIVAAPLGPKA
jgi:glycosyltransferase involved in cell wall biosynthesis